MNQLFAVNEIVTILMYVGDEMNEQGRVNSFDETSGLYWVTNMNMPFMGTVSSMFSQYELESINA